MTQTTPDYDVIVAGGGPAGCTVATLLAMQGHRVLLAERAAEPRFRVGESLMPATYWTFERLGLLEEMKQSRFPAKHSVQFFSGDGRASAPFYFSEDDPHESSQTWQVLREDFDELMRRNAADHGVGVACGLAVKEVLFEGDRAVGARTSNGDHDRTITARVIVDATGQSALLSRRLKLREDEPRLRNVSFYTHFDGGRRDEGIDGGATLIFHTEDQRSWFWFIPLPDDRVSVGLVGPVEDLIEGRESDPQSTFDEALSRCRALAPRLQDARQAMEMKVIRDFSYRSRQMAGEGWVLVGDAYGFIDPIYSSGIFLALESGKMAADAIHQALTTDDLSAAALGRFGPRLAEGMDALERLVYAFYDPDFSFSSFLRRHPERRQDIVDMLVGRVFERSPHGLLRDLESFLGGGAKTQGRR